LSNNYDQIEAQLRTNWTPIATPLFPRKSFIVDYKQVMNSPISMIFAITCQVVANKPLLRVKKWCFLQYKSEQVQLRNATFGITQRSAKIKTEERALRTFPSAVKSLSLLPVQKLQNDGTVN
jgi:hypothetical protein